jgi:hypothetical protein
VLQIRAPNNFRGANFEHLNRDISKRYTVVPNNLDLSATYAKYGLFTCISTVLRQAGSRSLSLLIGVIIWRTRADSSPPDILLTTGLIDKNRSLVPV